MNNLSDFLGGGKPKLITRLTSGTSTYIPTVDNARCLVRVQGGGGGGCVGGSGGGGAFVEAMLRIAIAGIACNVGAGGAGSATDTGTSGSDSNVGQIVAKAGLRGYNNSPSYYGGCDGGRIAQAVYTYLPNSSAIVTPILTLSISYVSGGCGGSASGTASPGAIGNPMSASVTGGTTQISAPPIAGAKSVSQGAYYGGGDAFMGIGGSGSNSGNGGNGNGYGSGGGAAFTGFTGGNGASGCIEIWDYGA